MVRRSQIYCQDLSSILIRDIGFENWLEFTSSSRTSKFKKGTNFQKTQFTSQVTLNIVCKADEYDGLRNVRFSGI